MTENVTRLTLFSNPDKNIFETINDKDNVADPKKIRGSSVQFVYRNDPWQKGEYDGYPYIILKFPSMVRESVSADGNSKKIVWSQELVVRSEIGGARNNSTGDSSSVEDMHSILDDLNKTFDSKTVKDGLRANNMFNMVLSVVDNDDAPIDKKQVFETVLELKYDTRMRVGV